MSSDTLVIEDSRDCVICICNKRIGSALFFFFEEHLWIDINKIKVYFNLIKISTSPPFSGGDRMDLDAVPEWILALEEEDAVFIKNFILASGSLKELANVYGVTYPTIRLRLDRLIQKIKMTESKEQDEYIALIKRLAFNEKLDLGVAQLLVSEYKKMKAKGEE